MRVAVCATQVPFVTGGAEAMAETLHRELLARGFESTLVTIPFAWIPRLEIVESALAWRLLSLDGPAGEPDLVIATRFPSYLVRHPNKVIWLVHQFRQVYDLIGTGWSDFRNDPRDRRVVDLVRAMDARAFAEARALYAISGNVAERARHHNGVEATVLYPPPRLFDRLVTGAAGDYVFTAGRLDELKRVELLIDALALTETPARCRIAGEGPLREALAERVRRHGLERRVELLGRVTDDELIALYRDCLAVYYAPYDEDYGIVPYEAFMAEKPVITTTDAGGPLDVVADRRTGLVVEPRADAVADACTYLLGHEDEARAWGQAGRAVAERLSWRETAETLVAAGS